MVLQCLYSQCQTAQFGVALHHALTACSKDLGNIDTSNALPPLIRQQGLRKRAEPSNTLSARFSAPIRFVSVSAPPRVARAAERRFLDKSAALPPQPTRSAGMKPPYTHPGISSGFGNGTAFPTGSSASRVY